MAYVCTDVLAGSPDLYQVDTLGPGPLAGLATGPTTRGFTNYPGLEIPAYDPFLGAGKFVFAKASATIAATAVVEISVSTVAGRYDTTATAWAGTAQSGKSLAVALSPLTVGQFGWFQVEGIAVATVQGAPAAGGPVYWQAAGVVSPTLVASKQVLNGAFGSAVSAVIGSGAGSLVAYSPSTNAGQSAGTLSATQALVTINRPVAQGQIT